MAASTLDKTGESLPRVSEVGTRELGPSDSSDSGSDLIGPGLAEEAGLGLDTGSTSDLERRRAASVDVGDANLDSNSDSGGTGERAAAGRDARDESGRDLAPDRIIGGELPSTPDALDRIATTELIDDPDADDEESKDRPLRDR